MEQLFEEDLADARAVRLVGTAGRPKVRTERPIDATNRGARRGAVGSGSGSSATIVRVGNAALQQSGAPLSTHEQALAATASGALLAVSLLGARFPRFVAWPMSAAGGLLGGLGLLRAARSVLSDRKPRRDPDHLESRSWTVADEGSSSYPRTERDGV